MRDLLPQLGVEPGFLHWERRALTTGPPEKSLKAVLKNKVQFKKNLDLMTCLTERKIDQSCKTPVHLVVSCLLQFATLPPWLTVLFDLPLPKLLTLAWEE